MTDDIEMEWTDPPTPRKGRPYAKVVEALKAHPDQWARIEKGTNFSGTMTWRTGLRAYGDKVVVSQRIVSGKHGAPDALYDVYAMWPSKEPK